MSSFIERFSVAGSAGVIGLMLLLGAYGFVSLWSVEPRESSPPGSEQVLVLEGRGIPLRTHVVRPQVTPAAPPDEASLDEPEPLEEEGAADEALIELEPSGVLADGPVEVALDGPAPAVAAPPAAAPAPPTPAPAPQPAAAPAPAPVTPAPAPVTPAPPPPTPQPTPEPTPPPEPPSPEPTPSEGSGPSTG